MTRNQEEIIELLKEADDLVNQAAQTLVEAQRLMKDEEYSYNIMGNMDGYVINYLTGGSNSISDKIQAYIGETIELESDNTNDE